MRTCVVCGCTDDMACEGGCSWSKTIGKSRGVCSACPAPANPKDLLPNQRRQLERLQRSLITMDRARRESLDRLEMAVAGYEACVAQLREFHCRYAGNFKGEN